MLVEKNRGIHLVLLGKNIIGFAQRYLLHSDERNSQIERFTSRTRFFLLFLLLGLCPQRIGPNNLINISAAVSLDLSELLRRDAVGLCCELQRENQSVDKRTKRIFFFLGELKHIIGYFEHFGHGIRSRCFRIIIW